MKANVRRFVALLSLLSAVATVLFAGKSYLVCPWMKRAVASCCCPADRSGDGPAISRAPCCDRRAIDANASAPPDALRGASAVPTARAFTGELVRIVDRLDSGARASADATWERGARDGPEPALFELHSSYLI